MKYFRFSYNLSYFEEKGGHLVFTFSQIWFLTAITLNLQNLQPILDCNTPKIKLKHQQFQNGKAKFVSTLFFCCFRRNV